MTHIIPPSAANLTLRQKVGQLLLGQAEGTLMTGDFSQYLLDFPLGGYRVNGPNIRNAQQVRQLLSDMQALLPVPAFLGADEEGGTLSVFGTLTTDFPGNMALGAAGNTGLTRLQSQALGFELSGLGINLAFAPVIDVNLEAANPVIGVRAYGDDATAVAAHGSAAAKGLADGGVLSCFKHFPGHGNTRGDSHSGLPENTCSLETLLDTELIPYHPDALSHADSVMVAHVVFPSVAGPLPASVNPRLLAGLLRETLRYDGVVFSDDMNMGAIAGTLGVREAVVRFILAGGDCALVNGSRQSALEAFEGLLDAVACGRISHERLDLSVNRILSLKRRMMTRMQFRTDTPRAHTAIAADIASRAVSFVRGNPGVLPLTPETRLLVLVPELVNLTEADTSGGRSLPLAAALTREGFDTRTWVYRQDAPWSFPEKLCADRDCVLLVTASLHRFPALATAVRNYNFPLPVVGIMLRDPADIQFFPESASVLASFGSTACSLDALAEILSGKQTVRGQIPVRLI